MKRSNPYPTSALLAALGLISLGTKVFADPAYGLDSSGLMVVEKANAKPVDFSFVALKYGVQVRIGEQVRNVIFYAPGTVRVNTTLGRHTPRNPA